jgi:hypothetical protein
MNSDFSSSKGRWRLVGGLRGLQRPVAHVLHAQRGRDDQDLGERLALPRLQDHAAHARVQGQARELPADLGERARGRPPRRARPAAA